MLVPEYIQSSSNFYYPSSIKPDFPTQTTLSDINQIFHTTHTSVSTPFAQL